MQTKSRWILWIVLSFLLTFFGLPFWGHADDPPPDQELTPTTIFEPIEEVQPNLIGPYNPSQIKTAYGFNRLSPTNTGAGQKIAIIVPYGYASDWHLTNDLELFCNEYSLPPANLVIYYPTGQPSSFPMIWEQETALDVQWAHAMAPGATIQLVIAKTVSNPDLMAAVQYATDTLGANVVSMSWTLTGGESQYLITTYDSYFNKPGTIFVASSGDQGSAFRNYPAVCPRVLSVGGTSLSLNEDWTVASEMAWSNSGGCVSAYEAKPDYQINFGLDYLRRGHPDVAFHTMVEIFWRFSKYSATGTSVGTPCWAALIALANQGRCTPLTDAHQVLYSLAGTQLNFNPYGFFRDITEGNNGDHYAGPGHDLVTGLGAPVADRLIPALRGNTLLPILYFLLLLD